MSHSFSVGLLKIEDGTQLRALLSTQLGCDRMRIAKKFKGLCFGKAYTGHAREPNLAVRKAAAAAELANFRSRFKARMLAEQDCFEMIGPDVCYAIYGQGGDAEASSQHFEGSHGRDEVRVNDLATTCRVF